jgi:hypothetical protein
MKLLTQAQSPTLVLAQKFAFSIVPIAVVYNTAHYYTLLLTQGQAVVTLASDPFGLGWNIFGTAGFVPNVSIIRADLIWYSQVFLIVLGHVAAVYLAHSTALKIFKKPRLAIISQLPMLVLMVSYTLIGLWILSQPYNSKF